MNDNLIEEFEALFSPGFFDITLENFKDIFVNQFAIHEKRNYLAERFFVLLDEFKEIGLNAEIWIDGSYSTLKPEPNDIDVLFLMNDHEINLLTPEKRAKLTNLFDRDQSKIRYKCDLFLINKQNTNDRIYWRGCFGFNRKDEPKGIPKII